MAVPEAGWDCKSYTSASLRSEHCSRREGELSPLFIHDHTWLLGHSIGFSWLPEPVDTKLNYNTSGVEMPSKEESYVGFDQVIKNKK